MLSNPHTPNSPPKPTSEKPGYLITLEGGEGGGKTTQIARLQKNFESIGKEVVVLREPGGTVISEQIRQVVLSAKNVGMVDTTEVLLFQAARAQIYGELVLPALKQGKMVLMDRSRDSSVVYQGIVRGFGAEMIESLNDISTHKTYPDATILLDVDVSTGLQRRVDSGEINRLDMENHKFHEQVREAYLNLAREDRIGRWIVVDANKSLDEVEKEVWRVVREKVGLVATDKS